MTTPERLTDDAVAWRVTAPGEYRQSLASEVQELRHIVAESRRLAPLHAALRKAAQAVVDEANAIEDDVPNTRTYSIPRIGVAALRATLESP